MSTLAPYSGNNALGCSAQVTRARGTEVQVTEIKEEIHQAHRRWLIHRRESGHVDCKCAIAENGCLDVSLCLTAHTLADIPFLPRWCDETTKRIPGGGHLILWSGWARPSVLKMSDRYCTVDTVNLLVNRSHRSTLHLNFRFEIRFRHDEDIQQEVIDLIPHFHSETQYRKAREILKTLDGDTIIGSHH